MIKSDKKNNIILYIIFALICISILYPFLLIVGISFSKETDVSLYGYKIIPKHFDLTAYKYILNDPKVIVNAYKTTITFSLLAMILGVLLMSMAAYALSSPKMKFKTQLSFYFYFTMLFSGGLVPSYILITQYLHLNDTIWVYILPGLISPWYIFMLRSFFKSIPTALIESMKLDGADEYTILFRLVIPLSKPAIATIALFLLLTSWNNWYTAMLYINDQTLISLQYLLQKMMKDVQFVLENNDLNINLTSDLPSTTLQMAMAVLAAGPAMLVFPFFQKYFVKGITVGSVKG